MMFLKQFCFSVVFFTRVRIPVMLDFSGITLGSCAWTYPLIGILVGAIGAAVFVLLATLGVSVAAAAWAAIFAQLLFTGGLHEDGLADTADGMAFGRTPQQKLDIMRDSRIGSFGVLALIAVVGLRASLFGNVAVADAFAVMIASASASRSAIALLIFTTPRARPEGMASLAGSVSRGNLFATLALASLIMWALLGITIMLLSLCVIGVVTFMVRRTAIRHFGGMTGDVCGTAQQLAEVALLMAFLLCFAQGVGG